MAPTPKATDSRRKSGLSKPTLTVVLRVSPPHLRAIVSPASRDEEKSPSQESKEVKESPESKASPVDSNALPAPVNSNTNSNGDNASDSNAATPAPEGTPAPSVMGPPTEGAKKKGVKRSAAAANGANNDGIPKPRGRPGPKKKPRLDDGTDPATGAIRSTGGHKLGPKANQGAINAGLRALDRSGKPCRKWARGGFKLKSFTGVVWEIHRWTAPPSKPLEPSTEESVAPSADSSSKENKQDGNGNEGNSVANSTSAVDVEMHSVLSVQASSPAPIAVAAAS